MTAQIHEVLILDGAETTMAFCPRLPSKHSRIFEPDPDKIVKEKGEFHLGSTSCGRGYLGTWEIRNGKLYLVDLCGRFELRKGGSILADWFSGELRVPNGKMLRYVHSKFDSVYERELNITIKRGKVMAIEKVHFMTKESGSLTRRVVDTWRWWQFWRRR